MKLNSAASELHESLVQWKRHAGRRSGSGEAARADLAMSRRDAQLTHDSPPAAAPAPRVHCLRGGRWERTLLRRRHIPISILLPITISFTKLRRGEAECAML
ncbi:unnamed protein product, partial [Iphiclides podalirius]